ncbi:Chalcone isomerase-like protein [compost metagenome]
MAALYTTIKGLDTSIIINSSEPRSLTLTLLRKLDGSTLVSALDDGLKDNSTEQQLRELQSPIKQFTAIVGAIEQGLPGDTIALNFNARHVTVMFNGRKLGAVEVPASWRRCCGSGSATSRCKARSRRPCWGDNKHKL